MLKIDAHTHVGEGESPVIEARHGKRTVDYLEELGFAGPDAFYAHCWELTHDELKTMAASGTGVSHCPEPVYLVGAEVTDDPKYLNANLNERPFSAWSAQERARHR